MKRHIASIPASLFAVVLGVSVLGTGWRAASQVWGVTGWIGELLLAFAASVWALLTLLYLAKWVMATDAAMQELRHPVRGCYVGLLFVATLLIALAVEPYTRDLALALATFGWLGNVLFAVWFNGAFWRGGMAGGTATAALYLPAVAGGFVGSIAASVLGYEDLAAVLFGAGLFSWLGIESVLIQRLFTGPALPVELRPTLAIQLAPPVIGCLAYLSINGGTPDVVAKLLLGYGFIQALVLIRLLPWIAEGPITDAFWGFSFGAAAIPLVLLRMIQSGLAGPLSAAALPLFVLANLVILFLLLRSLQLLVTGRLLTPPTLPALQ